MEGWRGGWVASLGGGEELKRERQQEGKRKWSAGGRGRRPAGEEVSRFFAARGNFALAGSFPSCRWGRPAPSPRGP